ncbi:uncharacterized protein LOC123557685 [Mercenaria mercenaria]|uniref:uncharacterized protein LOC123557685 n=1 Tax=Mercenaria mercenaria TaxID=6596 RepID=UPI00234EFB9B|nr:uncharacterized protein LOC123557685 [Mercenaria mercenaria]XP_053400031.1 uncharacterized protein LOC123557685 [Mercenaria mercenaria]
MASRPAQQSASNTILTDSVMAQVQVQGQGQSQGQTYSWLGTADQVAREADDMMEKLRNIRIKYRPFRDRYSQTNLQNANKILSEYNEELYSLCSANRRKYMPNVVDKTMILDQERQEAQKMMQHYETRNFKLEKELKEAIQAKERALNRLSDLQSRLLKYGNPEITDLSDENRPTNLGQNFKQLYEDEWTDAFEFLTEKRPSKDNQLKDEDAIDMLYSMLKRCNAFCSEALTGQHAVLAQLVSNPQYLKKETISGRPQSKPQATPRRTPNVTKLDVKVQPAHQKDSESQQAKVNFSKTMPAGTQGSGGLSTSAHGQLGQQGGNETHIVNKNAQPGSPRSAQLSDVYDAGQMPQSTKPSTGDQTIKERFEVPFKEFSKSVAAEVLRNISVSDILQAINKDHQIQEDVLQNAEVQKYLEKCFHLCWLMLAQYPPMVMDFEAKEGKAFDNEAFETYTNRGPTIARIVWPPIYLHKDGPLVCKGYAEGTK